MVTERGGADTEDPKSRMRTRRRSGERGLPMSAANVVGVDSPDDVDQYLDEGLPDTVSSVAMDSPDDSMSEGEDVEGGSGRRCERKKVRARSARRRPHWEDVEGESERKPRKEEARGGKKRES